MIVAINYADENFRKAQEFNTKTAYKKGKVDKVIEYSPKDIDKRFYEENKEILSQKRGGGYWLWKPYIIKKTMEELKEGDYLFYCDSGAIYVNRVQYLVDSLEKSGPSIMAFELPLIECEWTKRETFDCMNLKFEKYGKMNQILATYILIKINKESKMFIDEYLETCKNKDALCDNLRVNQDKSFIDHRHDQSIFSLLVRKYKLDVFRDPSQFGDRPWEYCGNNRTYIKKEYINSKYPKIVISNRKMDSRKFLIKEKIKTSLYKINLMSEKKYRRIHRIL